MAGNPATCVIRDYGAYSAGLSMTSWPPSTSVLIHKFANHYASSTAVCDDVSVCVVVFVGVAGM